MINYLYVEDSGIGAEFWGYVNKFLLNNNYVVQGRYGVRNLRKSLANIDNSCKYCVIVDYVSDNYEVVKECKKINNLAVNSSNIVVIQIHSLEQLLLSFAFLCDWTGCSAESRVLVNQFNSAYHFDSQPGLDPNKHKELIEYKLSYVTGSSERLTKHLFDTVTDGSGFRNVKDRPNHKHWLGHCWKHDCCGADRKEFNVLRRFRDYCELKLTSKEKFIKLRDNSDLKEVCNRLG